MTQHKARYDEAVQQITAPGAPFEIVDQLINGVTYKCYKNAPGTMPELFAPGREFGDKEFLVYEDERWTFKQFFRQADSIAKEFRDGWFLSGDIGYFDAEGFLFLSDRAKDMVIRGGENIFPVEIESTLLDHPAVHEVAVFGVPHEKLGEELAVVVVSKAESTLTVEEVTAFASERLARFKVPTQVALQSEPLPRNATNKVLKKHVKEAFLQR